MKIVFAFIVVLFGCGHAAQTADDAKTDGTKLISSSSHFGSLLSLDDAIKILGEPAHLSDSSCYTANSIEVCKLTYTSDTTDTNKNRIGNIYFMVEKYPEPEAAHKEYFKIFESNQDHEGVEILTSLGSEAYYHSDGENFCFILIRVDEKMLRMKVNKLTVRTSVEDFKEVADRMAEAI